MCLRRVARRQIQIGLTEPEVSPQLMDEAESMRDAGNRRQQTPLGRWREAEPQEGEICECR